MEFIVRGVTIVNPERCFTADVWVKGEKIYYIHEHIAPKPPIKEIDGSEQYMLPGFFHFGSSLGSTRTTNDEFKEVQKSWLKKGFTIYVDELTIVHVPDWRKWLGYELAMHHNSRLAHRVRLRVPYRHVSEALIRSVLAHRIPMLEMMVAPSDELTGSFWSILLAGFAKYRLSVKISFTGEWSLREKKRWLCDKLSLLVSMLEGRGIPLVLDEDEGIIRFLSSVKYLPWGYVAWEMNNRSSLSFRWKQFGQVSLAYAYTEQEEKREHRLRRLVEAGARLPAKLFSAYPDKGAIVPGTEADFFLLPKKNLANDATFWSPTFVYTKGRRSKQLFFATV
ncbi:MULTISPECIES: hypothetical protein [Aneurinibacillus]|uniref:Amidohydrolase family protein n=1 Tax=Aneurinibacillus thermoaerophilus TaxID=143495 RepID=A0A1G8BS56_ANETH|nr:MULTISPECIES: hypothetical protein [Aneurinibacillus]AMA73559.1 hypothetical protein ACH33_12295 [Aneurinibacillus sp. XH2]MED0674949.1 hypothetical protein [Aneurinibacillus thermoaerophilus]MED0679650.1 hypothetical protein [Aneurinibacillus thermoaerophilus]MED0737352.1 hypothetical protein [Aneurinibacillus thermoaerophilus]MED0756201.1 hypothetical protein [Aneurinibacillus thermoaerophilus]